MSDPTEYNTERVSLRDYLESRIDALADHVDQALELRDLAVEAREKNIELADAKNNIRLEGMNEFRDQLRVQASSFVSVDAHAGLVDRYNTLKEEFVIFRTMVNTKASAWSVMLVGGVTLINLMIAIVNFARHGQ